MTVKNAKETAKPKAVAAQTILLSLIDADFDWNSRQGDPAQQADAGGEFQENEFNGLIDSLRAKGQDQPVCVRPTKSGKRFRLVYGFRRFRALQVIAEKDGVKDATILAIVKDLSDIEARSLNIRENTARKQLTAPDLARSLVLLRTDYKTAGVNQSVDAMANEVGVGRPYASKLFKIYDNVIPAILKQWADAKVEIGVVKMGQIASLDKDRQLEAFTELLPTAGRGAGGGRKDWIEGATKAGVAMAKLLGNLERKELISTENLDFADDLESILEDKWPDADDKKSHPTDKQRAEMVKAIQDAYDTALNPPPPKEKAPKKEKGAKADKGDSAEAAN